jgi:hypothetical protein
MMGSWTEREGERQGGSVLIPHRLLQTSQLNGETGGRHFFVPATGNDSKAGHQGHPQVSQKPSSC